MIQFPLKFLIYLVMLYQVISFISPSRSRIINSYPSYLSRSLSQSATLSSEIPDEIKLRTNHTIISWYPGHIAKAERELAEYLKKVDVVIEVRDARIPYATTHPSVPKWVGSKPLIVAMARLDQVSKAALKDWRTYYTMNPVHPEKPDAKVFFIDGKLGTGVAALKREALKAGITINERRMRRGIQPRPVRAAVIGFPNVGKSALINRLLGRKLAKSQNLPGVTRQLQWIRIGGLATTSNPENCLELLDSPGIIPARQFDQEAAVKLAICNDIGEASYDRVVVAGELCKRLNELYLTNPTYVNMRGIKERYNLPNFHELSGDEIVYRVAEELYHGNIIAAADRVLGDFRKDFFSYGSLEAPIFDKSKEVVKVIQAKENSNSQKRNKKQEKKEKEKLKADESSNKSDLNPLDVGKGNYEGW